MSDPQARFFESSVESLMIATHCSQKHADAVITGVVVRYLQGGDPGASTTPALRRGRTLFPVLTDAEVDMLPMAGAPHGRIEALILQVQLDDCTQKLVRFDLTEKQADAFNEALEQTMVTENIPRDFAWLQCIACVGKLLAGHPTMEGDGHLAQRMSFVFGPTNVLDLPLATEEDSRDLMFVRRATIWTPR